MTAVLFVILMIAPASISASYLSYYLPLYFTQIGRSITDVGRAQLLYGMTRRESKKAISHYLHERSAQHTVFTAFDEVGLGTLLNMAVGQIHAIRPDMMLGAIGNPILNAKGKKFCLDAGIGMLFLPQTPQKSLSFPPRKLCNK